MRTRKGKILSGFAWSFMAMMLLLLIFLLTRNPPLVEIEIENCTGREIEIMKIRIDHMREPLIYKNIENNGKIFASFKVRGEGDFSVEALGKDKTQYQERNIYVESGFFVKVLVNKDKIEVREIQDKYGRVSKY